VAGRDRTVLRGTKAPKKCKPRKDEWTEAQKERFLVELAASCNVSHALRKVRKSSSSLYRLRRREAEFRAGWSQALSEGYAKLELELLDRAMNGTVKTVVRGDGRTETITEYPNNIALALLKAHKETAAEAEAEYDSAQIEEVRERIIRKLGIVRQRMEEGEE